MTLTAPRPTLQTAGNKHLLVVHAKAAPELGEGMVEAVTSVFDVEFTEGGWKPRQVMIHPGAFTECLQEKPTAPIMWQHQWEHGPIGQTIEEQETDTGLHILGEMFLDDPLGKRVWRTMLPREEGGKGTLTEWSIGFRAQKVREETRGTDDEPEESLFHYEKIDRAEHSVVLRGANPLTETISVNSDGAAVFPSGHNVKPCHMPSEFTIAGRRYVASHGAAGDAAGLPTEITLAGIRYVETAGNSHTSPLNGAEAPTPAQLVPGAERLLRRPEIRKAFNPTG